MRYVFTFLLVLMLMPVQAQKNKKLISDTNTPLHLLQPTYETPYGTLSVEEIKADLDRIFIFLDEATPAKVIEKKTGETIIDYASMNADSELYRGLFRLTSYEWGVTYAAMLAVSEATNDKKYRDYVNTRFSLLAETLPHFRRITDEHGIYDSQMKPVLKPEALDDAGAVCAAMIKAQQADTKLKLDGMIADYLNYILYKEHRLSDGTFARNRPQTNTLWLDDMFMSVPAIAYGGHYKGENKYFNEAIGQIKQFSQRMFVPAKGLYRHGWVEGASSQPTFHWARANGWAILTLTEVLDVLPKSHPEYAAILEQYRSHVQGIATCQSGTGFWHQLLDRNDSYPETSATAIFTYCIARGINKGWIDPIIFGPVAQLGWHAVSTKINQQGHVEGTCVGTGMGFDPAFYYYRPINALAAHGYGPTLLAGSEMINLLKKYYPKMNDSALQYYKNKQNTDAPLFEEESTVVFTAGE